MVSVGDVLRSASNAPEPRYDRPKPASHRAILVAPEAFATGSNSGLGHRKSPPPLAGCAGLYAPHPEFAPENLSVAGRVSPDLTTSPGAVDAGHYAEQCFAVTGLHYLGSYRRPNSVRPDIKARMPNCSDLTGRRLLEKNDLLFGDHILRIRASRLVLGGKDRVPTVANRYPSRWQRAVKGLIWDDLATRADKGIA